MTSYSPRARAALAGVLALAAVAAIAVAVHQSAPRGVALSQTNAPESADVAEAIVDESTTIAEPPTESISTTTTIATTTTSAPAPAVATTPSSPEPPPPSTSVSLIRHPTLAELRAAKPQVACQFADQGNWLGQMQMLQMTAPALAGRRVTFATYFPAEALFAINMRGNNYTDLDAAGQGIVRFPTTPAMVGQQVRVEVNEYLVNNHQNDRYCAVFTFTVPPPS